MSATSSKPPVVDVLRHYFPDVVVPEGYGWLKMKCPFHQERDPSSTVNHEYAYFKCHACDASGDSWAIIMREERCDFPSAVRFAEEFLQFSNADIRGGSGIKRSRTSLSEETRPVRGQRSILQSRRSRKPLDGT